MKNKMKLMVDFFLLLLCILFAEQLLFNSSVIRTSICNSLIICAETLIPSLFCFMVLTSFLSGTGLGKLLALPLLPISRFLCLPPECGYVLLMSLVGGYPMGVKALRDAFEQEQIPQKTFQKMSLFCICPAPSFVIIAIGKNLLGNQSLGVLLYCSQVLALLFLGLIISVTQETPSRKDLYHFIRNQSGKSYSDAIVEAVAFSSHTMLVMCGYVLIFSVCSVLLCQLPFPEEYMPLLSASMEITSGADKVAAMPSPYRLSILAFFLSFGGFSVLFQIKSMLNHTPCHFGWILTGRLMHGGLSAMFTALLLQCAPQTLNVFHANGKTIPVYDSSTPVLTLCLIGMLVIFLNSLENIPKKQNK